MTEPKRQPIKTRIREALTEAGGRMERVSLMHKVFPQDIYPKAWRYQTNGGPPGCTMAFGRAVRELRESSVVLEWEEPGNRMVALRREAPVR